MINQTAYDNQMSKYEMIEQKVQNKVQQFYLCFEKWNSQTMERGKHKNQVNKNLLALHFKTEKAFWS